MKLETEKYLYDIVRAASSATEFVKDKRFEDFASDVMLRSAVERQLEIVGEALAQLARIDPDTAAQISEYKRIIAFRNILIHGYAEIDHRLVWSVLETKLPIVRQEAGTLLNEASKALGQSSSTE